MSNIKVQMSQRSWTATFNRPSAYWQDETQESAANQVQSSKFKTTVHAKSAKKRQVRKEQQQKTISTGIEPSGAGQRPLAFPANWERKSLLKMKSKKQKQFPQGIVRDF